MIPICHVQILPIMSGVQRSMLEIFHHLDRNIWDPHVVCQAEGQLTEELSPPRNTFSHCPRTMRPIHPWNDTKAYRVLKRLFKKHRFQVVHNQSAKPRAIGTFAAKHAGVPAIINHVRGYRFMTIRRVSFKNISTVRAIHCRFNA